MMRMARPRSIDHVVMPTVDLKVARTRLTALGFSVAPEATHPFGTANACVYFPDGTYLEPLSIGSREAWEEAVQSENVFVARDRAYRFRVGPEGISALALSSHSALDDDRRFHETGISGGPPLSFSRRFETAAGEAAEAGFKLAFAADFRSPDAFFFTCERTVVPAIDRSALEAHANGVLGISEIVLSEPNPSDFQYLLQEIADEREVDAHSFGVTLALENGELKALTPEGVTAYFGVTLDRRCRGLRFEAIVFTVADLASTKDLLDKAGIATSLRGRRLVVSPAAGQGAIFAFEEEQ